MEIVPLYEKVYETKVVVILAMNRNTFFLILNFRVHFGPLKFCRLAVIVPF